MRKSARNRVAISLRRRGKTGITRTPNFQDKKKLRGNRAFLKLNKQRKKSVYEQAKVQCARLTSKDKAMEPRRIKRAEKQAENWHMDKKEMQGDSIARNNCNRKPQSSGKDAFSSLEVSSSLGSDCSRSDWSRSIASMPRTCRSNALLAPIIEEALFIFFLAQHEIDTYHVSREKMSTI